MRLEMAVRHQHPLASGFYPAASPATSIFRTVARAVTGGKGPEWGLSLAALVIVKYRDSRTDTRTELEAWIR